MKRYTSCLVFAAWLCVSANAEDDGYVPPVPLHEAVTSRTTATDINDASLAGEQGKPAEEVADSLRQGASTPKETGDGSTLAKSETEAAPPQSDAAKMSEITGATDAVAETSSEAASVQSADAVATEVEETAKEPKAAEMVQAKKSLATDPIAEMMGGAFNTEANQRMADSFLSVRSRVLRLKANRDL